MERLLLMMVSPRIKDWVAAGIIEPLGVPSDFTLEQMVAIFNDALRRGEIKFEVNEVDE